MLQDNPISRSPETPRGLTALPGLEVETSLYPFRQARATLSFKLHPLPVTRHR